MRLFDRTAAVIVGSVRVDSLRMTFKIHKDNAEKPNTAEVVISNLSPSTRSLIEKKGNPLIVEAGYGGDNSTLFSGRVRSCEHVRKGADWETTIRSGDGEEELKVATVSNSWKPGVAKTTVLNALVRSLNLDPGNSAQVFAGIPGQFSNGYVLDAAKTRQKLTDILWLAGYEWSVQDGRVQVVRRGSSNGESVISLSSETGLLGSPTHVTGDAKKVNHVKFEALLQPFKPLRLVELNSDGIRGLVKVLTVDQEGDTHGGKWTSMVEAVPV